jgi:hypothetical protein
MNHQEAAKQLFHILWDIADCVAYENRIHGDGPGMLNVRDDEKRNMAALEKWIKDWMCRHD